MNKAYFYYLQYTGLWHDIESYPAPFQMGTCSNAEYTLNADGTVFVYNTQVVNQVLDVMTGTAVLASTDGSARLRVTFLVGGVNGKCQPSKVLVLLLTTHSLSFIPLSFINSHLSIHTFYTQSIHTSFILTLSIQLHN